MKWDLQVSFGSNKIAISIQQCEEKKTLVKGDCEREEKRNSVLSVRRLSEELGVLGGLAGLSMAVVNRRRS
jgi:hypothetical protein